MLSVTVVIVTHRAPPRMLERAVASVARHSPDASIHVVDNGGSARSRLPAHDEPWGNRLRVTTTANRGFGAAANTGIGTAAAEGIDVVVVLNDDVEVQPGWLEPLLDELDDPRVGAVQPLLVAADGETINSAGVKLDRFGAGSDRGRGESVTSVGMEAADLDLFTGGAVLLRTEFVRQVGGFDERFFLYYEDVDLAHRGTVAGWSYRLVPASRVVHHGSSTTSELGDDMARLRERNRIWSVAMHGTWRDLGAASWLAIRRVRHRPRRAHLLGLLGGVGGAVTRRAARSIRRT